MEMETSTEPVDPLTPGAAAVATQPEGECSVPVWSQQVGKTGPGLGSDRKEAGEDEHGSDVH